MKRGKVFLPHHIENCKRLFDLYKKAGLLSQNYEQNPETKLSEETKKLIEKANKDFENF